MVKNLERIGWGLEYGKVTAIPKNYNHQSPAQVHSYFFFFNKWGKKLIWTHLKLKNFLFYKKNMFFKINYIF